MPPNEREEFKAWLKLNQSTLEGCTPWEVAEMAVKYADFTMETVCFVLSHFKDAMQGSNFDNRSKMQWDLEIYTIEMISGKTDLYDQWQALHKKLTTGQDYDE